MLLQVLIVQVFWSLKFFQMKRIKQSAIMTSWEPKQIGTACFTPLEEVGVQTTLPFFPSSKELWTGSFSSPFHPGNCPHPALQGRQTLSCHCQILHQEPQVSDFPTKERPCAQAPFHPAAHGCPAWREALHGQVRLPNLRGPDQD